MDKNELDRLISQKNSIDMELSKARCMGTTIGNLPPSPSRINELEGRLKNIESEISKLLDL